MEKIMLEAGDRVAIVMEGKPVKAHVIGGGLDDLVMVTTSEGAEPITLGRDDVMLLYRKTPKGIVPFIMGAVPSAAL